MEPVLERSTRGLVIAGNDPETCWRLAHLFIGSEYKVTVTDSASMVLGELLSGGSDVVLLGAELEGRKAADLVPLLKRCKPALSIVLVSAGGAPAVLRRLRQEGIFYHALQPTDEGDAAEIREVVRCAFASSARHSARPLTAGPVEARHNGERSAP